LCATEEGYYEAISNSSKVSLEFQGGIMSPSEMEVFEKNEFYKEAVALRRWDDLAKDPNLVSPPISTFVPSIELALK
jgi:predicted HD phosphohydrolase